MPKSRRDKKVSLTKTNKKGLEQKQSIIEDIQGCVDKYPNVYLFSVDNMRNATLKYIRSEWKDSRFFFGKNKIMKLGLQRAEVDGEFLDSMEGQKGLLFSKHDKQTVLDWFEEYEADEFARSGFRAAETVILPEGALEGFSHAIEPHLRKLGMPTKLDRGIVTLISEYTVCEKGQKLTPEQAKILKLISRPLAKFKVTVECSYTKEDGFEVLNAKKEVKKGKKSLKTPMKAKDKLAAGKGKKSKKAESDSDDDDAMTDDEDESDDEMDASD